MTETDIQLVCPTELMDQALMVFCKATGYGEPEEMFHDTDGVSTATYRRVSDNQEAATDLLAEAGIPHDLEIQRGYDVDPMTHHTRFTPDYECVRHEIDDDELLIPVQNVYELLDKPDELRALITSHFKRIQVLPWDNQLEYSLPARAAARIHRSSHHE